MNTLTADRFAADPTGHAPAGMVEPHELLFKVVIQPIRIGGDTTARLTRHDAAMLASGLADDLALATWEDAEWR